MHRLNIRKNLFDGVLVKPEQLIQQVKGTTDTDQPLKLSYHLLQFMKKNSEALFANEAKSPASVMVESQPGHYEEKLKEEKYINVDSQPNNRSTCVHPLSRPGFFTISQNSLPIELKSDSLSSSPLAHLHCQSCRQNLFSVHTSFGKKDREYTDKRFDISFELRAADAAIRGFGVARQFEFNLPEALNLVKGVKSFSF